MPSEPQPPQPEPTPQSDTAPRERPLPTVIGPTENALRALLTKLLSTTRIRTYPAWVVLNVASSAADQDQPSHDWRRIAADALGGDQVTVDQAWSGLLADGLVDCDGALTASGAAELVVARATVAATTARLVADLTADDQAATRRVLDRLRRTAEDLLHA